jgi:KDO2-lipid IV(A) lauroyltransferase
VPTFYQDENPRELLRQLRRGGVIGVVADQDVEKLEGVFVDYFGRPSHTPVAPVKLAQLTQAPVLMGALIRKGHRYEVVFDPEPLRVPKGADDGEIARSTEVWSKRLEGWIRRYPDQWVWMHDRWRTQPTKDKNLERATEHQNTGTPEKKRNKTGALVPGDQVL